MRMYYVDWGERGGVSGEVGNIQVEVRCRQGIRVGRDAERLWWNCKRDEKSVWFCVANIVKMGRDQLHSPVLTWCSA